MELKQILRGGFGIFLAIFLMACSMSGDDELDGSKTEESRLEMPDAFSPNGDGINDVYKAKSNYRAIATFEATIFNRWGHQVYEWTDPAGGWDGHGADEGVYLVVVKARGTDGKKYHIRQAVNLIRSTADHAGSTTE